VSYFINFSIKYKPTIPRPQTTTVRFSSSWTTISLFGGIGGIILFCKFFFLRSERKKERKKKIKYQKKKKKINVKKTASQFSQFAQFIKKKNKLKTRDNEL
jgi:hypothetical protein